MRAWFFRMIMFASHCAMTSASRATAATKAIPDTLDREMVAAWSGKEVHNGSLHASEQEYVANHSGREDNGMANVFAGLEIESVIKCVLNVTVSSSHGWNTKLYDCPTFPSLLCNCLSTHLYFHLVEWPKGLLARARKTSLSPCLSRVVVIGHRGLLFGNLPVLFNKICSSCRRIDESWSESSSISMSASCDVSGLIFAGLNEGSLRKLNGSKSLKFDFEVVGFFDL